MEACESIPYEKVECIANVIKPKLKAMPKLGVICGSGLGGLADMVTDKVCFPYSELPDFPVSTVAGHKGQFVAGHIGGKYVIVMQGRLHAYEGYSMAKATVPVRVMKLLGVETLIVTNAAGGLNQSYNVGDFMIIKDQINFPGFVGINPLKGPNDERFGPRFPSVSKAYNLEYRKLARQIAEELGYSQYLREGVYCSLGGPTYETVTECLFLRNAGADAVGMSTCPEVIVAAHASMKVFGLSLITNKSVMEYDSEKAANHEEVLETGKKQACLLLKFISTIITKMNV
ncbi:purine nucleoside phosphorylase [Octopus sinensis]|uniref:Purine nucleoside phosphorylase n=1 Tax=Octopus sinensis TaxID=2607531 RepID=A0A7E6FE97_9MOLL|nr:purine nucleoside phosphorylase [Octopus sinensis]